MLLDLLDGALADRAEALALDGLTYRGLHDGAARVAGCMAARGVGPGERVAIYSENCVAFAFAYLATLRLGAIAVPVNVLYRADDLGHVLHDAAPVLVVASAASAPHLEASGAAIPTVATDTVLGWAQDLNRTPLARRHPDPEAPAMIVYTSGTTGRSKGAMLSHRNLAAICTQLIAAWRWQNTDALLLTLPLFHVHGLIAGLTTALCAGARVVLRERFDATRTFDDLALGDITLFFGVPTMYVRLLEADPTRKLPRLRLYVSGSAALSAETHYAFEARFGSTILERYGATEFGFALGNRYGGPRVPGSVGIPLPGVRVRIAAPDGTVALAPGEVGELLVAGPNVFLGYWHNPQATAAAVTFDDDGTRWYRSGDLARYDVAHDVYAIVGRIKEVVISGGFNVYPREVEDALEALEGVRAAAVIGKPDPARGEVPVAFVEIDGAVEPDALLEALRARLASFKVPKEIAVVDALPRNAMGKLDKPRLRARFTQG